MEPRTGRQTAYKVWIRDLHTCQRLTDEATGLSHFSLRGKNVVRVNVVGSVIDEVETQGYASIVLDDSSGSIRLKVWADDLYLLNDIGIGDIVFVVGRVAEFDDERYIRPEIVRRVDMDWALLRRLELTNEYGPLSPTDKVEVPKESSATEVEPSLVARERILLAIEKHEEIEEAVLIGACAMSKEKVMVALTDLLKEGEIFSPKKGYYRLV